MKITTVVEIKSTPSSTIIPIFQDDKLESNLRLIAKKHAIDFQLLRHDFKAASNEVLTTYFKRGTTSSKLLIVGLGEHLEHGPILKTLRSFFKTQNPKLGKSIAVNLAWVAQKMHPMLSEITSVAAIVGSYNLGLYKSDKKTTSKFKLQIISRAPGIPKVVKDAVALAETQVRVMDLVNAPANKLTPKILGNWVINSGKTNGFQVKVLNKKAIEKMKLNALLAVSQGSDQEPAFIIAEYKHKLAKTTVGLIGKGVTFDTGGLSIKGSANMHYMKSDMGGAAAVLGTIELAAKLKLQVNLVAIVPATENSVDAAAIKPGDIIDSYSGKTIEVIDTDAEGRLILSDALSYMTKKYSTDVLIDYATLTGSVIATLGYHAAGLFTLNEKLSKELIEAGKHCGERVWPLPMWSDYEEDLESDVADVKNYSGKPLAGAITAAKFLEVFTNKHTNWAHIDIAGTAFGDTPFGKQKNATAFGVQLSIEYLKQLVEKQKKA